MDKSKIANIAIKLGGLVEDAIRKSNCDIGLFVFGKEGSLGLVLGGDNGKFNEKSLPFLKEVAKRIQQVIDAADTGNLDIMKSGAYHTYDQETGSFNSVKIVGHSEPTDSTRN